jgi:hypothetical protein
LSPDVVVGPFSRPLTCRSVSSQASSRERRQPDPEQQGQHACEQQRLAQVRLHAPDEVQDAEGGGEVDQPVQALPAEEAEAAHGAIARGERERDEQQEGREADRDEPALDDVLADRVPVEELVDADVGREVKAAVAERGEPERAPVADRPAPAAQESDGCGRERGQQEDQGPEPEAVQDLLDRVGAEASAERVRDQKREREARGRDERRPAAAPRRQRAQNCFPRSIPS